MKFLPALATLLVVALPGAAWAAPVFPGASGVGLEPPAGMHPATTFNGFQAGQASIVITELPKGAYTQIDPQRAMFATRFGAKTADDIEINGVHGFSVKGMQPSGSQHYRKWIYVLAGADETALISAQAPVDDKSVTDAAIEGALHTITFRQRPGLAEQIAALPFAVGDLAGFRASGAALGAALILTDGPKDVDPNQSQAHVVVAANAGSPPPDAGRIDFAKKQLTAFQAVRTTIVEDAKLFDADGAQWAQVDAQGSEGQGETPVKITYFLRFGDNAYLSIVCIAPAAAEAKYADRFKSLALSTKPKG